GLHRAKTAVGGERRSAEHRAVPCCGAGPSAPMGWPACCCRRPAPRGNAATDEVSVPRLRNRRPRPLTPEERKSLTHGDFWIPDTERAIYRRALEALNAAGIPYVVAGAYAIYE